MARPYRNRKTQRAPSSQAPPGTKPKSGSSTSSARPRSRLARCWRQVQASPSRRARGARRSSTSAPKRASAGSTSQSQGLAPASSRAQISAPFQASRKTRARMAKLPTWLSFMIAQRFSRGALLPRASAISITPSRCSPPESATQRLSSARASKGVGSPWPSMARAARAAPITRPASGKQRSAQRQVAAFQGQATGRGIRVRNCRASASP